MRWSKMGRVFCAANESSWMCTHAANPVADWRHGDVYRIYFSARDEKNRSHIAWVEIDLNRPQTILEVSPEPVVAPGQPGLFDDSGASMGCLVHYGDKKLLYYLGWNLGVTVPFRNAIGLAMSSGADAPFRKHSLAAILDCSSVDPYSISYPWVRVEDGRWRMWYGSNLRWGRDPHAMEFEYVIKYAESRDGIEWKRTGHVSISFQTEGENAIARPCVLRDDHGYHMWYSHRGESYRIGYAQSEDGLSWIRLDSEAGIDVSESGWDSDMIEYPHVFNHGRNRYMLYNGNGYGKTGFGLAVLEERSNNE